MNDNGEVMWKKTTIEHKYDLILHSWTNEKPTVEYLTPENSPFKCVKSLPFSIIIMREKDDDDSSTGKSIFFYERKCLFTVKPEFKYVYLTLGDDFRVYFKDIQKYVTARLDPSQSDYVNFKVLSEKRITKDEAKELSKTTNYIFNKEEIVQGSSIFGTFVSPKNGPS